MMGICRICKRSFDSGSMIAALAGGIGAQELVEQYLDPALQGIGCQHHLTSGCTIDWSLSDKEEPPVEVIPASP